MGFSTLFIRRPVATSLLMVGVLMLGILGYRQLPVSALPEIDAPTLVVTTQYPGANATTMTSLITTPLERQLGQISGLDGIHSESSAGLSTIVLQFSMRKNIDVAAQDVQAAIQQATLPSSLPYQPVFNRVNPADAAIITLKLTSQTRSLREVNQYADAILAQRLSQVPGVGLVSIAGNVRPAIRIQVNPSKLASLGMTLEMLRASLTEANVNAPKGSLNGKTQTYSIGTNDQLTNASQYRQTIIRYINNRPIRLADIATVIDGAENDQVSAFVDAKPAILLQVRRQPGANIVKTVEQIHQLLPHLRAILPTDIHLEVFSDRTETIRASVHDVKFTLVLTITLVVMVIFLFLRRLWATFIPSIVVPLSLAGTFAAMAFAQMSLDNLSLMALVVATGFVVDDAIVMIENIVRYVEKGHSGREAAEIGAKQIGFTVVSLTISLVAVFLPLLLMPGVTGRLFHEFAWVLSIAVSISMLVSLTLTPMMCAYLLRPTNNPNTQSLPSTTATPSYGSSLIAYYERSLRWVFAHQAWTMGIALCLVLLTVILYIVIPKELLPDQDTGLVTGVVRVDANVSFAQMEQRTRAVARTLRQDRAVVGVAAFVGVGSINPTLNQGQLSIVLKERSHRQDLDTVLHRLHGSVRDIPGTQLFLKPVQDIAADTQVSATQYQIALTSIGHADLTNWTARLTQAMRQRPELTDISNNLSEQGPNLELTIDRDKASLLGVPMQTIVDTLYDAYGQRQISTVFTELNQYRVVLEVLPQYRTVQSLLSNLAVGSNGVGTLSGTNATNLGQAQSANSATATGSLQQTTSVGLNQVIPISALAQSQLTTAPMVISHQQQLPSSVIAFNVADGYSLSQAITAINTVRQHLQLPPQVMTQFIGKAAEFSESQSTTVLLLLASLVIIYIVLGILYESYIHPLTIISTLPPAGVGALLGLMLCHMSLSLDGIVGIVLLIGIVKKNAIMMIDFALEAQRQGQDAMSAIHQACLLRFRPILMTTAAAMLGALPLALGNGIGAELRRPLGITIVGGLLLSQLVTLYTTPVVYLYFERLAQRLAAWRARRQRRVADAR